MKQLEELCRLHDLTLPKYDTYDNGAQFECIVSYQTPDKVDRCVLYIGETMKKAKNNTAKLALEDIQARLSQIPL